MKTFSTLGLILSTAIICLGGSPLAAQAQAAWTTGPAATTAPLTGAESGSPAPMIIYFG